MPRDLDVILIFAVLTTGAVLIIIQIGRLWRAGMLHKTIREAISRDNPAVPELVAGIEEEQKPAGANDDRTAMVLIALGLALLALLGAPGQRGRAAPDGRRLGLPDLRRDRAC